MNSPSKAQWLKQALHAGQPCFGTVIASTSPKSIEGLHGLDLDIVMLDTEHIPMLWDDLAWLCRTYRSLGIVPIVRIPRADPFEACRALDMGAGGIVAAYIESAEEVQQLRGATKLRPLKGKRLDDILAGREVLEGELADYIHKRNADNLLIVNIESVAAIAALDEILAVPGLDAVLIGPHDLSCSVGHPEQYDHPAFEEAVAEIVKKARARNIGAGIHNLPRVEQEIKWSRAGMNLIMHRTDFTLFRRGLHDNLNAIRKALGQGEVAGEPEHVNI